MKQFTHMEEILLIEDNLGDIFLVQSYLRDNSFTHRLHKAKTFQEGLDIIRHNNIDLVLLDLALDDTAGFNTLRLFQQEVPTIPVIVLTGTSSEVLGMQIVRAGAQDYLVKGNFDGKQLIRAIRHSIRRFKAQVELREQLSEAQHQEKRSQLLHQLVKLGSWELNLLDNTMKWSDEMYHLLGYAAKSFDPKLSDYLRMVHAEDQEKVKVFFQDATRHSKQGQMEHRTVLYNRAIHHFLIKAQVISEESSGKVMLIGSLQEITEFKTLGNGTATTPNLAPNVVTTHLQLQHLTDEMLQVLKKLEIGMSYPQKEQLHTAKNHASEMLDLLYNLVNRQLLSTLHLPVNKADFDFSNWKKKMSAMLETQSSKMKSPPTLQWQNLLPTRMSSDEQLLSLLLFNLIQNSDYLVVNKEALQINIFIINQELSNAQLVFEIPTPPFSAALARRKECATHLKAHLRNNALAKKEVPNTHASLLPIAAIVKRLEATLHVSKNYDIAIHIPISIPPMHNGSDAPAGSMLIVEHQTIMQIALKRILQAGMPQLSFDLANDLNEGIQCLSKKDYDLVLVDLQLPQHQSMDIVTALHHIKKVRLAALTPEINKQDQSTLREAGVSAFITKPPQREALLQAIREVLYNKS